MEWCKILEFYFGGGAERHANTHRFTPHLFYLCEFILNPMLPTLASMTDLICLKWLRFTTECLYVSYEFYVSTLPPHPLCSLKCVRAFHVCSSFFHLHCLLYRIYIFYLLSYRLFIIHILCTRMCYVCRAYALNIMIKPNLENHSLEPNKIKKFESKLPNVMRELCNN